jgi:hypothetical protein
VTVSLLFIGDAERALIEREIRKRDLSLSRIEEERLQLACKSRSNNPSLKRPIGLAAPE